MTTAPGELSAAAVISHIEAGSYPTEVVSTIARGFLPLPQEDLIAVLVYLALESDAENAALARTTLAHDVPMRAIFEFGSNESLAPEHLVRELLEMLQERFGATIEPKTLVEEDVSFEMPRSLKRLVVLN